MGMGMLSGCATDCGPQPHCTLPNGEISESVHYRRRGTMQEFGDYCRRDILGQVFFAFDSANLSQEDRHLLDCLANALKSKSSVRILIAGYCDWHGEEKYNETLGKERAQAVANYLQELGISAARMRIESRGSLESTRGLSRSQAQHDRRADIVRL